MARVATTWNPSDKGSAVTLSNGNLTAASNQNGSVRSVFGAATGKWYFEAVSSTAGSPLVGVGTSAARVSPSPAYPGVDAYGWSLYWYNGQKYHSNTGTAYAGAAIADGVVVGVKLDLDNGTLGFIVGGVDKGVAFTGLSGTFFAMFGGGSSGAAATVTANFGATAFANAVPDGYSAVFGPESFAIAGNVKDAGANVSRTVRAYRRDTGALVGSTTSDPTSGNYEIGVPSTDECIVVCLDDAAGTLQNDLIIRVIPA